MCLSYCPHLLAMALTFAMMPALQINALMLLHAAAPSKIHTCIPTQSFTFSSQQKLTTLQKFHINGSSTTFSFAKQDRFTINSINQWKSKALKTGFNGSQEFQRENVLDKCLAAAERVFIAPSFILTIGCAIDCFLNNYQNLYKYLSWQIVPLLGAVIVGAVIRARQWSKIVAAVTPKNGKDTNILSLAQRVKKLEEDVGTSVTIVRVLARQLEKLGVRFRVTRRTLRDPINETATLAKKISEAVQALATHEDALEKDLQETQHLMLAMQKQQQRQLELIRSLGKLVKQQKKTSNQIDELKKSDKVDDSLERNMMSAESQESTFR